MSTPEKYFLSQLQSHHCQLPPSDDFDSMKHVSKFTNFFLISEKSLQSYLKVKSLSAIFYEKRRQLRTTRLLAAHPFSQFHKLCQFHFFFILLSALLYFPFFSGFHGPFYAKYLVTNNKDLTTFYTHLIILFIIQLACLFHILLTFINGYFIPSKDETVIHLTGIAKHYLSTFFLVDLVSSLPIDAILVLCWGVRAYSELPHAQITVLSIIPLLKFLRLPTLNRCFRTIYAHFHSSSSAYNLVLVISLNMLIIHWGGCLLMLISRWFYAQFLFYRSNDHLLRDSLLHQYVAAVYNCLTTVVNTGFDIRQANNIGGRVAFVLFLVLGKIYRMVALIVFLQYLSTRMAAKLKYMEMMDQVVQYMNVKRFPRRLRHRIKVNYLYLFRKEYINEKRILRLLSDSLRREILLRTHQSLIDKVALFSGLSQNLIYDFINCLHSELYLADDIVYRAGDLGECMYFVSFGTVAIYSEAKEEIGHLHDGDHFGEVCLVFQLRRTATVVAIETTELFRFSANDFVPIIRSYPAIYSRIENLARERYERTLDSGYNQGGVQLVHPRRKAAGERGDATREERREGKEKEDKGSEDDQLN